MNPGEINKRITLIKLIDAADGRGGRTKTPSIIATVWAKFLAPKFTESVVQGGLSLTVTQGVEIRKQPDIDRGWRVTEGTRTYEVIHADQRAKDKTILTLKEVVHG